MKPLRLAILSHSAATRPDAVVDWAFDRGHAPNVCSLYKGESCPNLDEFDFLISMGGPMNCLEDERFPFLAVETKLLKRAILAGKGVLGLCLGAQLIARASGANVTKHQHWEVGWHKVRLDDELLGKGEIMAFHWHRDTFELPKGATRIASNPITPEQGFRVSSKVVGLQFHPEATAQWVRECLEDRPYPVGPHVQNHEEVVQGLIHQPAMNYWFRRLLQQIEGEL